MEIARSDPAAFDFARLRQTPLHLEWCALVNGDRELRGADLGPRVRLQCAAADADAVMDRPLGVEQPSRRSFGAEVDQFYLALGLRIRHPSDRKSTRLNSSH